MQGNHSGFAGYSIANIYPDMGNMMNQTMETVPDEKEKEALSAQEPDHKAGVHVNKKTKSQLWITIAIIIGLVFAFSKS